MGLLDKLLGREKKDAGEMAGDGSSSSDGTEQAQGGMAEGSTAAADEHTHDGPEQGSEHEH